MVGSNLGDRIEADRSATDSVRGPEFASTSTVSSNQKHINTRRAMKCQI